MPKVRTRYAPSPTGISHVGNIRTALFNFLFAKNQNGEFILRIEDTDQKRSTKEHIGVIKESLDLLNLKWDAEFLQSKRLKFYHQHLEILKEKKIAYQDQGAWRFKVNTSAGQVKWDDLVHGPVGFPTKVIEDFVIVKSDGFPTYHMASVVDDHLMDVTHVMRGDEWISSTPKHLLIYQAFGWQSPLYAHLPPILGANKKKLSKREGAKSVLEYINEGYLPEALINFLALLGWAPKGSQEIFSIDDLIKQFSIDRVNKNSPIFNIEKLNWFNGQWIRRLEPEVLARQIAKNNPGYEIKQIRSVIGLVRDRLKNLRDFKTLAGFFFQAPSPINIPKISVAKNVILKIAQSFQDIDWTVDKIKEVIDKTAQTQNVDRIETIAAVRNIISGQTVTPPLYESLEKLGKEETVKRLDNYLKKVK